MLRRLTCLSLSVLLTASAGGAQQAGPAAATGWRTLETEAYRGKRDDISFTDADHGWYGTGKGDLFATTDGGASWTKVASRPGTFIRALGFVDARTGFIGNVGDYYPGVTDTVPLYRTDDGGRTWTPVDLGGATVPGICAIDVLKTERIYQGKLQPRVVITAGGRVGGPANLIRSVDGGRTWRVIDMGAHTGMILDVRFLDEQTGFVAASSGREVKTTNALILMTRDGGATWRVVYQGKRPMELIWKLSFPTDRVGYGTVQSYDQANAAKLVVKTTDGGRTWRELPLVTDAKVVEFGVGFTDAKRGWVGTTIGGFETTDGGKSFTKAPIAPAANKVRVVRVPGGGTRVYAIGTQVQRLDLPRG